MKNTDSGITAMKVVCGMMIASNIFNRVGLKKGNIPMMSIGVGLFFAGGLVSAGVMIRELVRSF